ncbi:hypothetical protein BDV25DRAFT_166048 [Aspergillus avenaceus]|uniref:Uncharacterized protein n=1 Tax=Aspergillus avenaceus TaxID=36643 RepID=A0A5N6TEJ9_ASPAV|nr:hypothetical protein BDV25DRAFT_166048 [Aspergillus avenaceus]
MFSRRPQTINLIPELAGFKSAEVNVSTVETESDFSWIQKNCGGERDIKCLSMVENDDMGDELRTFSFSFLSFSFLSFYPPVVVRFCAD